MSARVSSERLRRITVRLRIMTLTPLESRLKKMEKPVELGVRAVGCLRNRGSSFPSLAGSFRWMVLFAVPSGDFRICRFDLGIDYLDSPLWNSCLAHSSS